MYGLADTLKEMSISVLGLDYDQVFGTDSDKNSKTKLKWENMPAVITPPELKRKGVSKKDAEKPRHDCPCKKGTMTAREVLQYVGTDVFRKMNSDMLAKQSAEERLKMMLPRSPSFLTLDLKMKLKLYRKNKGFVIGLTRDPYEQSDRHSSESEIEKVS